MGYSHFKKLMQYRLDTDIALVLASAVDIVPTASAEDGRNCVVTIEHVQKVPEKHKAALSKSLALEWKSVLTSFSSETQKRASSEESYWTPESAKKVRRLVSEPMSPAPAPMSPAPAPDTAK